ncbi:IS4 family transposase [Bacillus sp. FJAT-47783]|uniref:IS4 family transposase n=1 Tax=Bacillus sp. FJAT-47783 TaxID=2922712 RepID=UPI001FADDE78|nr:IS4 family transposase [Bacillus sp. FJAT-47783]
MKKNTTLPNLLQKIISEDELKMIVKAVGYKDTARKFDVQTLIEYLVTASANEWKSFRHGADVDPTYGLAQADYSTFSKKASHVDFEIMKQLFDLVVSKCNRQTRRSLRFPRQLVVVDSTTMTVGKSRLPWAVYHGERSGVKLHVGYLPELEMPIKVIETIGTKHDRPIGEQFADNRYILVKDRAYFKIKRLDQFVQDGQDFVIRMKDNVELFQPHALKRMEVKGSPVVRDMTCQLGTPQARSTKRHRVVIFRDDQGREFRVVTNLRKVSAEKIADMYKARWSIEVFFRWVKQHLNVPVLFGTTKNAVYNQLFAALIAYVLLKWLYDQTAKRKVFTSLSFITFKRKLLTGELPIDWFSEMMTFLKSYSTFYRISLPNFG